MPTEPILTEALEVTVAEPAVAAVETPNGGGVVARGEKKSRKKQEGADLSAGANASATPTRSVTQPMGAKERSTLRSVALDLGVHEVSYCEVAQGQVVQRRTVKSLQALEDLLGPSSAPARVAIEACREAWFVHDTLRAWGHDVLLVDTTRSRQLGIGQHGRKNDRIDAEHLARAVERGGIPLAHVLSPHRRGIRELLGVRRALIETRTQYIVTLRGLLRSRGEKVARCEAENFVRTLSKAALKLETRATLAPLVSLLEALEPQIAQTDAALEEQCAQEPVLARLTTAPGVGLIVAAAFVSVVDEAKRFRDAHQLASYLGLVPLESTSGSRDKRKLGSITKHGNAYLRSLLTQAAHVLLRHAGDDPLRQWALLIEKRRGRRIAVVALARRLAGVLWGMWRSGTVYDAAAAVSASANRRRIQSQSPEVEQAAMKRAAAKQRDRQQAIRKGLGLPAPTSTAAPKKAARRTAAA